MQTQIIRQECLVPASQNWQQPTTEEIREVLRLAQLSSAEASRVLGIESKGDRVMRRWVNAEADMPYAAWAILCDLAGLGLIWRNDAQREKLIESCASIEELRECVFKKLSSISEEMVGQFQFMDYYEAADALSFSGNKELSDFFDRAGMQWDSIIDKEINQSSASLTSTQP